MAREKNASHKVVGFENGIFTVQSTLPDGRVGVGKDSNLHKAQKAAKADAQTKALVQANPAPAPAPVASAAPQIPSNLFKELGAYLAAQGMQIVPITSVPKSAPVPTPVHVPVVNQEQNDPRLKGFYDDLKGFSDAQSAAHKRTMPENNGGKRVKSNLYKTYVDEYMIEQGFKPFFRGLDQAERTSLRQQLAAYRYNPTVFAALDAAGREALGVSVNQMWKAKKAERAAKKAARKASKAA